MKPHEQATFRFGRFVLVPSERLLLSDGKPVALTGKVLDLLVTLVRHAGHLLTKDELLQAVWPRGVVEEVNLSVNVSALRKVLGAAPEGGWIETVPRQGYRFNAAVEVGDVATSSRVALPVEQPLTEAYQAYLQGRYLWNQRSEPSLQGAVVQFLRAIELDPRFALAHAALADAHASLGYLGYVAPSATFPVARPYALKALELDPTLAQAHAALAYIKFYFDWDWQGAGLAFTRAIELNPNDPVSRQWYAVYLLASGQPDRGFGEVQAAHRLDPLSLSINTDIGFHHCYNGRYVEAVSQLQSVLAMRSDFLLAHLWLARTLLEQGKYNAALGETAAAEQKARAWSVLVAARGFTYGKAGMIDDAEAVLQEMDALSKQRFVTAYGVALVHAGLGQSDEAFRWLDRAFDERSHWLVWLRLDPRWKGLHGDARFAELISRMRYPA